MAEQNECLIVWDKKLELGIPVIDEQHIHLVELCNRLYQGIVKEQSAGNAAWHAALSDTLRETAEYIQIHFRDEEKLLKAIGYNQFAQHKMRHQEFALKTMRAIANFDKATLQSAFDFVRFLYDWILAHIACEDKLYVKPVKDYMHKRASGL